MAHPLVCGVSTGRHEAAKEVAGTNANLGSSMSAANRVALTCMPSPLEWIVGITEASTYYI
jgi:hypothetical protein